MNNWLQYEFLDNTVECYLWFSGIITAAFILRKYLSRLINLIIYRVFRRFTRENRIKEFQHVVLPSMEWLLMFLIISATLEGLTYPAVWNIKVFDIDLHVIIDKIKWVILLFAFTRVLLRILDFAGAIMIERAASTPSKEDDQFVPFIKDSLRVIIYVLFLLILLGGVLELNITSLLAGLGIGGLALAFAAQESIKDLFGSVTIFFDKPFLVGDVVKVGEVEGTVEKVGFRSTRIRSYDQTFVTMPNKKMMENHVDNLTQRQLRRVRMTIGLSYKTKADQMKKIIEDIKALLRERQFDKDMVVTLENFGTSSLDLLLIYYTPFMVAEEFFVKRGEVNFEIMDIVYRNGSSFAYPVREIITENKNSEQGANDDSTIITK